ncbi:MAG: hypothetical protein HC918_01845 [Oscillatoriales cyanobacterium SM2_1_8]|nr:hypothetical protein [Oscillatoriales cyanobacterium SM2_1_8]
MEPTTINCQEACVNGCVLGERCPNRPYLEQTRQFVANTSIDRLLEIAASRFAPPPPGKPLAPRPKAFPFKL